VVYNTAQNSSDNLPSYPPEIIRLEESENVSTHAIKVNLVIYVNKTTINKKDGYHQLNVRQLGSLHPWDHRGKCYMGRKTIQCWSNAWHHVPIYLQPFTSYSKIFVGNCNFFLPPLHLTPPYGVASGTIAVNLHGSKENSMLVDASQHVPIYL